MNRRSLLSLPLWAYWSSTHGSPVNAESSASSSPLGKPASASPPASAPLELSSDKAPASTPQPEENLATRQDVRQWATDWAKARSMDPEDIVGTLAQVVYQPDVARAVIPPAAGLTAKSWQTYRARYLDATRIRAGAEFSRQHTRWLTKVEADSGIPQEIVLGILGVETIYGRRTGNYRALDALATLAFNFPSGRTDRSVFFREELGELFLLTERTGLPITGLRGSFAGAMGLPQFMPSSWNRYGVDGDGDGHTDLLGSAPDAIASIAHFLTKHGWTPGVPVAFPVTPPSDSRARATLLQPDILPTFTAKHMQSLGMRLPAALQNHPGRLALVELQNGASPPSYVVGTQNFYVVTRYNWSSYYAMAVIELGQAVVAASKRLPT